MSWTLFSMNAFIDLFCWPGKILLPRSGVVNDEKENKLKKLTWIPKTVIFLVAISGTIYNIVNMPLTYGQVDYNLSRGCF